MIRKLGQNIALEFSLFKNLTASPLYAFAEEGGSGNKNDFLGRGGDERK